jgi:hypothetical protein
LLSLEREHFIFIAVAAAAFAALLLFAFYNPFQQTESDKGLIKVKKGDQAYVRYSSAVVKRIQDLPDKNSVEVEVSSELQVTNLGGLNGEVRYTDMTITWAEEGEEKNINDDDFKSIEYRFLPDIGNKTRYVYENADYITKADGSQLIVAIKPLSSAKVGEQYTVSLILHTGGLVDYQIAEKIVEVVP